MEAEKPRHTTSTSIPAIEEFRAIPEAIMRSSQIPALDPEAQEGQDPPYKWREGHRLSMTQPRELRDMSVYAAESMLSVPKEGPADVETSHEDMVTEAQDTPELQDEVLQSLADRGAETLARPERETCPIKGEGVHVVPISSELGSRVEVEFGPEQEKKETSPNITAQTRFWILHEEHLAETSPTKDSGSGTVRQGWETQGSNGQERDLIPWETQELEEQEPQEMEFRGKEILGQNVRSDGLWREQEQMVEQVNGKEGEQRQVQQQEKEGVTLGGERGGLSGELGGLSHGTWGQEERERRAQGQGSPEEEGQKKRDSGLEERWADCQQVKNQSSVEGTMEQDESLKGKATPVEGQGEQKRAGSGEGEPGNWDGGGLGSVGEPGSSEEEECQGPSPLAAGAAEVPSSCDLFPDVSCPMTQTARTHMEPGTDKLSPGALTPTLEPIGRSLRSMSLPGCFPTEESLENKVAHCSQQEGSQLRKGTEVVSAYTSVTPPGTPDLASSSLAKVAVISTDPAPASPPVAFPGTETPKASLSADHASSHTAPETTLAALHASPAAATEDPSAGGDGAARRSPLAHCGTVQHLRSNSFPGSHRTEQAPDLAGISLSFSHLELPQRPPKPAISGSVIPRRDRRSGRDCRVISESSTSSPLRQDSGEPTSHPEGPSGPPSCQPCGSPPPTVSWDMGVHEPLPPPPLEKRHSHAATVERDGHLHPAVPMVKRFSHPPPLALSSGLHGPPKGPLPQVPDPPVSRQHRPLPSTPDCSHLTQTSFPARLRYNKPLPPTPDVPQAHHFPISSSSISRIYRPLPPVPIMDPSPEPPPLPPKTRGRSRSARGGLVDSGAQAKPRPVGQDWTASTAPCAGRTSWPPAMGRSAESLAPPSRSKSEMSPNMAFSNMINFLGPSSPTTPWTVELQGPATKDDPGPSVEADASVRGLLRRSAPPDGGSRKDAPGPPKQPEKPSHPQLEKASSWPHRRDAGRPPESSSGLAVAGEGSGKHKGWNRQGLRRPSILPEGSDSRVPALGRSPGSDAVVFREKKPKESTGGFSRRCSKLINSSHLLYQEYSDVFLNKEIQSQQRLDSLAESPGLASPRQPRKALVSSESYLQRLSMASSGSLWQEIPVVRNSTVLLSMTHEDQKLQEAKFELIVSEASYLRSLHIAVDHFQLSSQLRATLSNQEYQWLFSRLQDVRDVSTTFLSDLEENFENNIFSFQVCDVVLSHAPDFRRVYLPYVTNQTYQERTFQSLLNSNSSFREVLEKLESDPICQRLSLKSFLILPFQRITRLKLLLQNILKRTQPGSSEEAEATKAHHALEELIRDCNNNVQRMRRTEELIYLSQKIEFECKIFPLISQSRWLVKSGELMALEFSVSPGLRRKLNTRPVHLHLFNDCLLLSRPREGNRFLVFDHAPFSSIRGEKCEMKLHGAHKNLFRLFLWNNAQGTQAEFLFRTETQSEKLRWISALAMPREELDLLECYDSPQVQCLRAYKPRENDELALEKADVVMVTQQSSDGWLEGVRLSDGEQGWFPVQQVEFISNPEVRARNLKEAHRVKTARLQLVEQ